MFKIKWQKLGTRSAIAQVLAGVALSSVTYTPVSAQSVVIQGISDISQPSNVGSMVYGSPIPMPMPVDRVTGFSVNSNNNYLQQRTPVNPTLVTPNIVNQTNTLINPVIVHDSWQYPRIIRRSRIIHTYPY